MLGILSNLEYAGRCVSVVDIYKGPEDLKTDILGRGWILETNLSQIPKESCISLLNIQQRKVIFYIKKRTNEFFFTEIF